jgi:hypothetical protein
MERSMSARVTSAATTVATTVATLVLVGWILDIKELRTLIPGSNAMVASSAMCFLLLAGSLSTMRHEYAEGSGRWAGRTMALGAALVGLLKLGEYAFGWNLGLDQTLLAEDPGSFPGQMAIPTAISVVLLGMGLCILDVKTRRGHRPAQWLVLAAAALPVLGLIGRLYGVASLVSLGTGTAVMAVPTAITFLVLGTGILAARSTGYPVELATSPGPAGVLLRRLVPTAFLLLVLLGGLRVLAQRAGLFGTEFGTALMVFVSGVTMSLLIWRSAWRLEQAERKRRAAEQRLGRVREEAAWARADAERTDRLRNGSLAG